jgi:hypothetical protein
MTTSIVLTIDNNGVFLPSCDLVLYALYGTLNICHSADIGGEKAVSSRAVKKVKRA